MKRRIGKFDINQVSIEDYPAVVREIIGRCKILGSVNRCALHITTYTAISDDFELVIDDGNIPRYTWNIVGMGEVSVVGGAIRAD